MSRARVAVFVAVLVASVAIGLVAVTRAADRAPRVAAGAAPKPSALPTSPYLAFRSTARDGDYGRVVTVPLDDPGAKPTVTPLECAVVDASPTGGICLKSDFSVLSPYSAVLFGNDLTPKHQVRLEGGPSRTRLSPDGRLAATTVFVTGHSYAAAGFSTATTLIAVADGKVAVNLEDFAIRKDDQAFSKTDFNFWGVTFAENGRDFYATLGTSGTTYLMKGDAAARTLDTVRENVECPSLSPDGTRIAFKKRVGDGQPVRWRLHVLDLATGVETALAETASVDDQVEWLDDQRVLYSAATDDPVSPDVYVVAADGSGAPRVFRKDAASPSVVRP